MNSWLSMFETRPLDLSERGLKEAATLLARVFPNTNKFSEAYLKWLYLDNPTGQAVGANVYKGDELVTHFVFQPHRSIFHGGEQKALQCLNLATHPDYRGQGLFNQAGVAAVEEARSQSYDHIFAVTNSSSTTLFQKHLNFSMVTPLTVKLGVGKRPETDKNFSFDYRIAWSKKALAWRLKRPDQKYLNTDSRGRCTIYTQTSSVGPYVPMLTTEQNPGSEKAGLGFKLNPFRMWMGWDPSRNWSGKLYFDLPDFLKPSPLNLIFLDLTEQQRVPAKEALCFNAMDFDAY